MIFLISFFIDEAKKPTEARSALIEKTIRQYADMICRIAFQHTGSQTDAEDILQEVSVALVTKDAPLEDEEHLKHWLIRVTVNKCHDWHRHRKRTRTEPLEDYRETAAPEEFSLMEELWQLPETYRTILYLYYYENLTLQEIADSLRKSINTVSSGLQRGRKKLKEILMQEGWKDG